MSAPITTLPVIQDFLPRRGVEPQARRRAADTSAYGNIRGRASVKNAAILANLAEWVD